MEKKKQLRISDYHITDDMPTVTVKVSEIINVFIDEDDEGDKFISIDVPGDSNYLYLEDDDIIPTYFEILKAIQSVISSGNKHDEYIIVYDKNVFLLSETEII